MKIDVLRNLTLLYKTLFDKISWLSFSSTKISRHWFFFNYNKLSFTNFYLIFTFLCVILKRTKIERKQIKFIFQVEKFTKQYIFFCKEFLKIYNFVNLKFNDDFFLKNSVGKETDSILIIKFDVINEINYLMRDFFPQYSTLMFSHGFNFYTLLRLFIKVITYVFLAIHCYSNGD